MFLQNLTICIGITTNQFVNPVALRALQWKYYLVYLAFLAFELVYVFLFLIETKGKTLEETAAIFDGQQQIENIANVGHDAVTQSRHRYAFQQKSNDVELSLSRHNSMVPTIVTERDDSDWRPMSADTNFSNKEALKFNRHSPDPAW